MAKDELDLAQVTQAVAEVKTAFEQFKDANEERTKSLAKGVVDPLIEAKLAALGVAVGEDAATKEKTP